MTDKKEILSQIAKEYLSVETLETRNSDVLDFHDCSVWGIKAALEEAFRAGKRAAMLKPVTPADKRLKTAYLGLAKTTYEDLNKVFGPPNCKPDGYKVEAEWLIELPKGCVLSIYNYKSSMTYDSSLPPITKVSEWSIAGSGTGIIEAFIAKMKGRAQMLHTANQA